MSLVVPGREDVGRALDALQGDPAWHGANLLLAVAVGPWAEGQWQSGQDVELRAVYVLPATTYLGLGSWWDEIELVRPLPGADGAAPGAALDLVAFEVAKVARLALKGHRPTLAWLAGEGEPLVSSAAGDQLAGLARQRLAELADVPIENPPPRAAAALYAAFDTLVRTVRTTTVDTPR